MPYFLAIDAGGTSTRCLIADETRILARASTGSVKLMRVPEAEATTRLTAMLNEVSVAANVPLTQIARTCIGLAGVTIPAVRAWATNTLAAHVSGSLVLLGDEEIALEAAFPGASGILLIAGTGSNCIARAPDRTLHRAGGHGPILGDEGGGFWIGLEATRAALRALDSEEVGAPSQTASPSEVGSKANPSEPESPGAPSMTVPSSWVGSITSHATELLTAIQHHFHLTTLPELIELGNRRSAPAPDFASLAPVIACAASDGNPIAAATLRQAGAELATLITLVATKLNPPAEPGAPPMTASPSWVGTEAHPHRQLEVNPTHPAPEIPVAFTGSILAEIPAVHAALTKLLARTLPTARLQSAPVDPLLGALHRARQG